MRIFSGFAAAVLAFASLVCVCGADPTPAATSPAPAGPADTGLCLAYIESINAASPAKGTYAITLAPLDNTAGIASGSIAVYAGNERYDIPFQNARVVPRGDRKGYVPLLVRFSKEVHIDGAYVASLSGPEGGPCEPIIATVARDALYKPDGPVAPILAPQAVSLPAAPCAQPDVPAKTLVARLPSTSSTVPTRVMVDVVLSNTGAPMAVFVLQRGANRTLDAAAMQAAINSTYSPQVFRCTKVGGRHLLVVDFGPEESD